MKNVSIKFRIRKDKENKKGFCPVYYYIGKVTKGRTIKIPAQVSFHKNDWDEKLEKPKNFLNPNNQKYYNSLLKVKSDFMSFACDLNTQKINITEDVVKSFFRRVEGGGSYNCFYAFFEEYINKESSDNEFAKNTFKAYKSTLNVMKLFKQNLSFNDIDLDFIKKYDSYLKNKRGNKTGGIFNRHKHFKALINVAIKKGNMSINPYKNFKIQKVNPRINFLTEENLKEMESLELNSVALVRSKDMFLLSCYTGLRYGDIVALTKNNIKLINGKKHVVVNQQKTKKDVEIMLPDKAKMIVEKYCVDDKNLLKISNQKVNKNLKIIAEQIEGIDFNLTYHIARHTFATFLMNYPEAELSGYRLNEFLIPMQSIGVLNQYFKINKNVSIFHISKLLGHSSIKETQVYAKAVSKSMIEAMEVFNN